VFKESEPFSIRPRSVRFGDVRGAEEMRVMRVFLAEEWKISTFCTVPPDRRGANGQLCQSAPMMSEVLI
jgi:hypothetical protein